MSFDKKEFFARTMHSPDSKERAMLRGALRDLSKSLIPLHRHLIDASKSDYAFAFTPIASPSELLRLLKDDEFFSWLKPLTWVIVDIDEMARRDFEPKDAFEIAARVESFLATDPYLAMLQRDVDVAAGHATVRAVLAKIAALG